MNLFDPNGNAVNSFEDWANIFLGTKKEKHWKKGRSAWSLAEYIFLKNGIEQINKTVSDTIKEEIFFEKGVIEMESRFDKYGKGREHDLGIYGKTKSGRSVFIGLEAKVDESFGDKLLSSYLKSKSKQLNGVSTNAPERIEGLIKTIFKVADESVFDLRYQLFYAVTGTLSENADISILLILVFKTDLYDELKSLDNYHDYIAFMLKAGAEHLNPEDSNPTIHRLTVNDKELFSIYRTIEYK